MADRLTGRAATAHLLRRAGFGPSLDEVAAGILDRPFDDVLDGLLKGLREPAPSDPAGFDAYEPGRPQQAWLDRMVAGRAPLSERLTLFWHGHFATSDAKVQDTALLWAQIRMLREKGAGKFRDLVLAVSRDVAMIRFLDGNANRRGHPNENYARELQELFTLGIGEYGEHEVREVARAFTGWGSKHHAFAFTEAFHDHGQKTLHGKSGDLGGEEVVAILTALPASRRFLAKKLLRHFSHPDPTDAEVDTLASVHEKTDGDVASMVEALLRAPAFLEARHARSLVRSPVDLAVCALRAAGFASFPAWGHPLVERMGQVLLRPPSVKGWTSGVGWLGSASMLERLRLARRIADETPPERIESVLAAVFGGDPPPSLAAATGRDAVALALASPEFQLA